VRRGSAQPLRALLPVDAAAGAAPPPPLPSPLTSAPAPEFGQSLWPGGAAVPVKAPALPRARAARRPRPCPPKAGGGGACTARCRLRPESSQEWLGWLMAPHPCRRSRRSPSRRRRSSPRDPSAPRCAPTPCGSCWATSPANRRAPGGPSPWEGRGWGAWQGSDGGGGLWAQLSAGGPWVANYGALLQQQRGGRWCPARSRRRSRRVALRPCGQRRDFRDPQ